MPAPCDFELRLKTMRNDLDAAYAENRELAAKIVALKAERVKLSDPTKDELVGEAQRWMMMYNEAQSRVEDAEKRASAAEDRAEILSDQIDHLRKRNDALVDALVEATKRRYDD